MSIFKKLSVAGSILILSASSALAVSIQITHTGVLDLFSLDPDEEAQITPGVPTVKRGDTFAISYQVDIEPDRTFIYCPVSQNDCFYSVYGDGLVSFETSSGFKTTMTNGSSFIEELDDPNGRDYSDILARNPYSELYLATYPMLPSGVFQLPEDQLIAALNYTGTVGAGGELYLDILKSQIGYSNCGVNCNFEAVGEIVTTASAVVVSSPPIAAVPVPAPFLMLGMAMLGLIGFGRRARA